MEARRVLVTGAAGFIGTQATGRLRAEGWDIHTVGRRAPEGTGRRLDLLTDDPGPLIRAIRPSHLLHLAWVTDPADYQTTPKNTDWADASVRLLMSFAAAGGSHAVCAGTCLEYDLSDGRCREGATPLRPSTPYARAKDLFHRRAREALRGEGTTLAWARIFYLFGPGEHPQRLVAHVITSLLQGKPAATSIGSQRRDYLYVADAAAALAALLASSFDGDVNVGSGRAVAVAELVGLAAAAAGRPDLVERGAFASERDEPPLIEADIERLQRVTGWAPTISLAEGVQESVKWWRNRLDLRG